MNKFVMALILLLSVNTALDAKKKEVFDSIEQLSLDKVRHDMRRIDVSKTALDQFIGFTREIIRDYKEEMQSIFKSKEDLVLCIVGCIASLAGFTAVGVGTMLSISNADPRMLCLAIAGSGVAMRGSYAVTQGLACKGAWTKMKKAQEILSYLEGFGKCDQSVEEKEVEKNKEAAR